MRRFAARCGQVPRRNIFPAKTYRVIGQNQPPEQTPLPSRHLLLGEGLRFAVWLKSPQGRCRAVRSRAGCPGGRSLGVPALPQRLSGRWLAPSLATSSRPPAASFAVRTRPPCAPLSRGIPGQPRPACPALRWLRSPWLSPTPSAPGLGLASAPAWWWRRRLIVHLRWNVLGTTPRLRYGIIFVTIQA
jgi:hypothetical protein